MFGKNKPDPESHISIDVDEMQIFAPPSDFGAVNEAMFQKVKIKTPLNRYARNQLVEKQTSEDLFN